MHYFAIQHHWENQICKNLLTWACGVYAWVARNREEWRLAVSEANIHYGTLGQRSKQINYLLFGKFVL